jgi:hypothetical protein
MRRMLFTALLLAAARSAGAQRVPGRDLLDFPIGTLAEPAALASEVGDGLWNPATLALPAARRARASAGALATGEDQGVAAQTIAAAVALPHDLTVGLSLLHAAVRDLVHTETDPQSLGDIPYGTTLASALLARQDANVTTGVALRWRQGQAGSARRSAFGVDGGVVARGLGRRDARLGVSSFLWRPADARDERTSLLAAGDVRLGGSSERSELRAGYGFTLTEQLGQEHYAFVGGRSGVIALRAGLARSLDYGVYNWRTRLGVGLHYARYTLGLAREDGPSGLAPAYQFTLTSTLK